MKYITNSQKMCSTIFPSASTMSACCLSIKSRQGKSYKWSTCILLLCKVSALLVRTDQWLSLLVFSLSHPPKGKEAETIALFLFF